jgi:hypothetical protein
VNLNPPRIIRADLNDTQHQAAVLPPRSSYAAENRARDNRAALRLYGSFGFVDRRAD